MLPSCRHLLFLILLLAVPVTAPLAQEDPPAGLPEKARVARALFTTGIENREPVDRIVRIDTRTRLIHFFSDVRHMQGRVIRHVWEYEGRPMAEVEFTVGAPRWRVNSKKTLEPGMTGVWTVWVIDAETGWPLKASQFLYEPATSE